MNNKINSILEEIKKVIIGKDEVISKVFMAILSEGHILLEDVPGVGKTTLALSFRRVLGLEYKRVQFTSDSMPSDIIGFSVYDKSKNAFKYQAGAVMTNLLLADEINRTSSKTQSALLEVMEEKQVTVDGITHRVPSPFIVLATQNPVGSAGTQMLPSSQLDRFMVCLEMGYPDFESQVNILKERHTENPLKKIKTLISAQQLTQMQEEVKNTYMSDEIYKYVTRLAQATRNNQMTELGISPRGALAICRMAKAYAYVHGRDYVVPNDVKNIFMDVCAHRIVLNRKARISEYTSKTVLEEILEQTNMPQLTDANGNKI